MDISSVSWLLKQPNLSKWNGWGLPIGNAQETYTGDKLRSGSAGNDVGDVPCSIQMPFFLHITQSHLGVCVCVKTNNW